ncbi:MAG: acylphosphatase [Patescibacteria group bacterium]
MEEPVHEIECRVSGRVQLVMYRDFVRRQAKRLGLLGFVQNEKDGSVKIVAEGKETELKKLIELLHKGSFLSRVESVSVAWRSPANSFSDFTISFD